MSKAARDENIVGLTAALYTHAGFQKFYDNVCDDLEGSVGIYRLLVEVGDAMTKFEETNIPGLYDESGIDWYEWLDFTADRLVIIAQSRNKIQHTDWKTFFAHQLVEYRLAKSP